MMTENGLGWNKQNHSLYFVAGGDFKVTDNTGVNNLYFAIY